MINQENESFNNLNVNNNQTENDSTKPSIYWNEQSNEEAFLQEIELQNLFANTLLNDDFNDETDFNCLGIDNLQLNLNANESSNEQQHHHSNQGLNNDNTSVIASLSLIPLSTQSTNNSQSNDYLLDSNATFNTFDLNNVTNLISEQVLINDLNTQINILNEENNSNFNNKNDKTHSESIQNVTNNQDDNLFKKPNLFNTFFDNQSSKSSSSSSSSTLTDLKLVTKIKQSKKINFLEPIDLISQFKKLNNHQSYKKQDEIKLKSTNDDSNKKEEKNDQFNDSKNISSIYISSKSTNTNNVDINGSALSINKIFTLKRSRKRSKLLNTNKINQTTLSTANQDSITTGITSQTKINNKLAKLNNSLTTSNKAITKKEKKEKLKQNKINSNFEPLNKKFAGDSSTTNATSTESIILAYNKPEKNIILMNKPINSQTKAKKEEVELHIKELSLLDLHSSEDDSEELLTIKNSITGTLKKNLRSSSNDRNNLNTISISNKNNNYLNEIISKRIKYSPALTNNSIINGESNEQESFNSDKKEHRIDKLIQFLTKSSLDSNANSISSSTSSNESLQLKILNNKDIKRNGSILVINDLNSSLDLNLVSNENSNSTTPPTPSYFVNSLNSNQQNKRKKNENDSSYTNTNNETISCSLPSTNTLNENQFVENNHTQKSSELSKSLTIDNDTLQNMKNLDLNFDLKNIEKSILNDDIKSKEKNFKKNAHSVNLESTNIKNINSHQTSNLVIDLKDSNSRKKLWNLLKSNSSVEEMKEEFGSELHDKVSFWDLVNLKLKFSKNSQLKTTYEIIDDYTILYSNMSTLLESFVEEHSTNTNKTTIPLKKSENSSRSRSSSRNCRKQSSTASLHRI